MTKHHKHSHTRSQVQWRLLALLLGFGLAACGGDEPGPVAQPPFQPQAVQVTLGNSEETVTLMTTEAGGHTLDGEPFDSGDEVQGENGSTYTLTLDGSTWSAAYKRPEPLSVALGLSGQLLEIVRLEDGTYALKDGPVTTSETHVTASNGNV